LKHITRVIIGLAVLAMSGCIQSATVVTVKSDGSGTIEQITSMSAQAIAQLKALSSMGGEQGKKGGTKGCDMFDDAQLRAAAPKMGTGVRFVSSTPIKTAESEGVRALYAFDDITKLRIDQKPGGMDNASGMTMGGKEKEELIFRFGRSAAGNPVVTIISPEAKFDEAASKAKEKTDDPNAPAAMEMMKQFLKGMRIAIALRVDGRIVKTNSQYVSGPQVTLLEIDFDKLAADPAVFQKIGEPKTLEEAKRMLRGVPGVKVNLEREITVEFTGR
jgi:hypothetical protein